MIRCIASRALGDASKIGQSRAEQATDGPLRSLSGPHCALCRRRDIRAVDRHCPGVFASGFANNFGADFCVAGAQKSVNALAVMFYPTSVRSTGVGWALGIGRLGAILGRMLGG
jgi:hypothetical protein